MRYFFDTEFIEDGKTIDLISIGIVAEDGREYYAVSQEFNPCRASDWVKDNVLIHLPPAPPTCPIFNKVDFPALINPHKNYWKPQVSNSPESLRWKSREAIKHNIQEFVEEDPNPEFWAYYADYDWVAFCQLWGTMMDLPEKFPRFCLDIKQAAYRIGIDNLDFSIPSTVEHNALEDAKWNKRAFEYLRNL